MNIVVDTSIWSLALRRRNPPPDPNAIELGELIREGRVRLLGALRQELLSGIRDKQQFRRVRDQLRAFPDVKLGEEDYEEAAAFFNLCRGQGVQGSNTDFLICAVSMRRGWAILTNDLDFLRFARILPVQLHTARARPRTRP